MNYSQYFKENMNEYKYYYFNYDVQRYFLKYLHNREFVMLASKVQNINKGISKRNLRVHNTQSFQFWLYRLRAYESSRLYNLYYSLSTYKNGVPYHNASNLSWDDDEYNENAWKEFVGYDFFVDVDSENFENMNFAAETAESIKKLFDELNFPYYLRFSGRGFHFISDYAHFSKLKLSFNPDLDNSIYNLYGKIAEKLYKEFSEMIDFDIYDSRRICKIPFSLSIYDEGAFQCIPVQNLENYKNFDCKKRTFIYSRVSPYKEQLNNPDGDIDNLVKWSNFKI